MSTAASWAEMSGAGAPLSAAAMIASPISSAFANYRRLAGDAYPPTSPDP